MSENKNNSKDPSTLGKAVTTAALLLGVFTLIGSALIAYTHLNTQDKITDNKREFILSNLNEVMPKTLNGSDFYDNDILASSFTVSDSELGADGIIIYPAFKKNRAVGAIITSISPNGYNGKIKVIIGIKDINNKAEVISARVVEHKETPGLGDPIESRRSDWILQFDGRSMSDPELAKWQVKKDGGDFDQLTGATITPRAVTQAIKQALLYYETNRDIIFKDQTEK